MVAWGGNRKNAGRVSVVERKYCHYYLSAEEDAIEQGFLSAFREMEKELNRELSKELKCKQYEVAEEVYQRILEVRKQIVEEAIGKIGAAQTAIKKEILGNRGNSIDVIIAKKREADKKKRIK